ncbi:MAG: ATP phosphoribosyltransferase regulatory subunit [Clostridia bacterium]|nr:ATP phosphoribosyltransferase regulatory subunit [Clostridia bacterium]
MNLSSSVFRNDEIAVYNLRELYQSYGYNLYKINRFEEYDLYARNKNFLVSENILTFTDTNGRLMALKPDVTLSLIKNIALGADQTYKVFYNENVYRTSSASNGFKEIVQTGLECIGKVDMMSECEVLMLAIKSLECISNESILDISHMGFIEGLLDSEKLSANEKEKFLFAIESKNLSEIKRLCNINGIPDNLLNILEVIVNMYLPLDKSIEILSEMALNSKMLDALRELSDIADAMKIYGLQDKILLDFSVVNNRNYYNGITFKGFIKGIPESILSGGRYDKLLEKMGKQSRAIGFAVYLDKIERYGNNESSFDVDALIIYDPALSYKKIINAVEEIRGQGKSVKLAVVIDNSVKYKELLKITERGVELLERNDKYSAS